MNTRVLLATLLLLGPNAQAADVIVEVNGHAVRLDIGSPAGPSATGPTIVFESGLGTAGTNDFARVLQLLPRDLRVVRYDRPGLGRSSDNGESPTPRHVATILHAALAAAGIQPPYVLVGHSLGGLRVRTFAGLYPDAVVGLVFVDPTPDFTRTSDDELDEIFAPLGLGQKERDEMRALRKPNPTTPKPILAESTMAEAISAAGFPEIQSLPPLRDLPVVVLVGNSDAEWPMSLPVSFNMHRWVRQWLTVRNASLRKFATNLPRGTFVETTKSSHQIQRSEPELIVWAIDRVLQQR